MGHVQVGKEPIEPLRCDATERVAHVCHCDYLKSVAFQDCPQHVADSIVVIGE
jgi:hypothetical protein